MAPQDTPPRSEDSQGDIAQRFKNARPQVGATERAVLEFLCTTTLAPASEPSRIGRFELQRFIGSGATGAVFAASDPLLGRHIALKLVPLTSDVERDRVMREARALAQLNHPNVVAIHDVGLATNSVYLAMELVRGLSLRRWIAAGSQSWRTVVTVLLQAARGIEAVHKLGLIHGDIKPDNILVRDDQSAKVVDFGLVHSTRESDDSHAPMGGTRGYLAPELLNGSTINQKTDQFSFCVTLRDCLLTDGTSKTIPRGLRRIWARGLAEGPNDRFNDMASLADALEAILRRPRRVAVALSSIVLGAVIGAAAFVTGATSLPDAEANVRSAAKELASEVWNAERAVEVRKALAGFDASQMTTKMLSDRLSSYADQWVQARVDAWSQTHQRGEQSPLGLELRIRCRSISTLSGYSIRTPPQRL